MRGDAGVPETFQNIELAPVSGGLQRFRDDTDFIVIAGQGQAHGLLVERGKRDGFGLAFAGHRQRVLEVAQRKAPTGQRHFAAGDVGRVEIAQVNQGMAGGLRATPFGAGQINVKTGIGSPHRQDARIANHLQARGLGHLLVGEQSCGQFRADAAGIAHRQGNERGESGCLHGLGLINSWVGLNLGAADITVNGWFIMNS